MKNSFRALFIILALSIGLVACDDDSSVSDSDGGSLTGDGGARSAQYAGTYSGNMHVIYSGNDVNGDDDLATTIKVNTNGTVSLSTKGETVNGVINGNKIEIGLELKRTEDGVKCTGEILVKASIKGSALSGPIDGDAKCRLLAIKRTAELSGSIVATKR